MISRIIADPLRAQKKSVLLLGPRQVGKSTLIKSLKPALIINLADESEYLTHSVAPDELKKRVQLDHPKTVFIDEVQRLPSILNTVQFLIDGNVKTKFLLTGSSSRKLKRGGANLLPGRVVNYQLGPLVAAELGYEMNQAKLLSLGSLPEIYETEQRAAEDIVSSYAANYIREEIKSEALTRNLEAFVRFFHRAIAESAKFVDFTKLAKLAKLSRHSVPRYFEILEDTLIGERLYPYPALAESCDLIRHPKFFLFDNGVYNGLLGNFGASRDRIGVLTEQAIFSQLRHSAWAQKKRIDLYTFRTRRGEEVDFVVNLQGDIFAVEVKTNDDVMTDDVASLIAFKKAHKEPCRLFVFHFGVAEKKLGPVWSVPWQRGLKEIGL